jgi:2-polyprenyl-6-methoxyphenol hydroxylase-like FAD-dependent oxidoreductase
MRQEHAVVIGGSMAGLLASQVLAERYERVTVIERDKLDGTKANRPGVPQGRHTHGLLAGGRQALETLFRGISEELTANGGVLGDIVGASRWFLEGACHARFASGLEGLFMSRPFLEHYVRERVRKLPNVAFRENCTVRRLLTSANKNTVRGVECANAAVSADLVVDTSGRFTCATVVGRTGVPEA